MLVLFGGESPDAPIAWMQVRRDGAELARGVLSGAGTAPDGDAVLILRGAEAQLGSVDLPAKTEAQARGAAAFAFEGKLAMEPSQVFCAVGPASGPGGRRLAAALDRDRLRRWIARCRAAGCAPRAIYLDCTLLETARGQVRVREFDGSVIAAGGAAGGFSIEAALASPVLNAWLARLEPAATSVEFAAGELEGLASAAAAAAAPVTRVEAGDTAVELARSALAPPAHAPDLMQGEFANNARSGARGRLTATIVGLALVMVVVRIAVIVFDGWRDEQQAKAVTAAVEHDFRMLRPDVTRIVNLRAQVSAAINAARGPASNPVIAASYPVVEVLQAHPDTRLEEVRHDAPGRRVSMRFSGTAPDLLEATIADLRRVAAGLEVEQMRAVGGRASITVTMVAP
jgi:type II secretion system protein L